MLGVITSFVTTLAGASATELAASSRRAAMGALAVIVAVLFALASIGCVIAALWIFAAPQLGQAGAALAAAGLLLLLCFALFLLTSSIPRRTRRRALSAAPQELSLNEATRLFKENKATMLIAALVTGLLVGSNR